MADEIVGIDEPAGGAVDKKIDNTALTVGANTVQRQRINVSGAAADDLAVVVDSAPGASDHGLVVREVGGAQAVVGGGVEATAQRVTIASDSTGVLSVDDAGGALTVDHATLDNAHSEDFDTGGGTDTTPAIGIALPASGGAVAGGTASNPLRVDPTGTTDQSIDDGGNSITVDSADLVTIAGAVSGTEMQADIVAALPAGTNAIGKLAANSGVDIGDVDVLSLPALAAGTNGIGKLTANSGVDIGDVDVTSVPRSIMGPAEPGTAVDSYEHVAINLTTGANQVLKASAPSKQIWVYGYGLTCGDADGQTVSLQDEDDTALTGVMEFAQYGGISVPPSGNFSMPLFKLGTDKDLEIDITGGDVDGWIVLAVLSV